MAEANTDTTRIEANLKKPTVLCLVASEEDRPKLEAGVRRRGDFVWVIVPLLGYAAFVFGLQHGLPDGALGASGRPAVSYFGTWLIVDLVLGFTILAMTGGSFDLCVRHRRATPPLQGYVGVDIAVPSDDGESQS